MNEWYEQILELSKKIGEISASVALLCLCFHHQTAPVVPFIRSFVRSDHVTTISHERLEKL